ncbi:MAG: helix-turn-helix transcriptional regulator [Thermotogae bacterium]|nr:helix-turn-helix transcriptional regulator [Thermotogota bacterium]
MKDEGKIEVCKTTFVHEDKIRKIKEKLVKDEVLIELAEFFKIFGDSTRIKILCALLLEELCVCDLAAIVGASQSAVSHQLRILRQAKLVKFRKEGKTVFYSLDDEHIAKIVDTGLAHIQERKKT